MTGRKIAHYVVEGQLGSGGMGVVYRATDTRLGRAVALKLVSEQAPTESAREQLLREARTASALNHPNICTIYEAAVADGETYIAMELVEGRLLSEMADGGGLAVDTAIRYGLQIADALDHAHERGVMHRDLKSHNIIVTPEGRPKVLDFGLARRFSTGVGEATRSMVSFTQPGSVAGTLAFMAPEILGGQPADSRSDLWALGVTLHHMLTGSYPFRAATPFDLTSAIQRDIPAPLPDHVPTGLANIVRRLLAKQPGERYQRAGEVRAALEAIESSGPVPIVTRRSIQRWILAAAGVTLVGSLAWLGLVWRSTSSNTDPLQRLSDGAKLSSNAEANSYYEQALQFSGGGPRHDLSQVRALLEKALAIDPKFAAARAQLAFVDMLSIMQGDSNESSLIYNAQEGARQALQDDPECANAYSVLAGTSLMLGRKDLAPAEASKAIQANPLERSAQLWLPIYDRLNGDHQKAVGKIERIIGEAPTFWPARLNLADTLIEMGDVAAAVRQLQRILEVDPQSRAALGVLSRAHMDAGDLAKARNALERAPAAQRRNFRLRLH
ncbi:MAG: protein kinase domain-containing protein, partial [Bryobacteraceae bacterium]